MMYRFFLRASCSQASRVVSCQHKPTVGNDNTLNSPPKNKSFSNHLWNIMTSKFSSNSLDQPNLSNTLSDVSAAIPITPNPFDSNSTQVESNTTGPNASNPAQPDASTPWPSTNSSSPKHNKVPSIQYEQYAKEWLQVAMQDNFDGFRLEAMKAITPQLQASHSILLGTTSRPTGYLYQFGPTFCLENGSMFFMSRYGTDGIMSLRAMKHFKESTELRLSCSSSLDSPQQSMVEMAMDYSGDAWCTCLKAAWQGTWILNTTFSQLVTPQVHLGGDLTWIAATGASIGSVGFRYELGKHIWSGTLMRHPNCKALTGTIINSHSTKLQYCHKVSPRLNLGLEFEASLNARPVDSALRFGYEYLFRQARIQGLLDTGGKVTLMAQDASGFGVSGLMDYWKGDYRFGFMMQMFPSAQMEPPTTS